MLPLLYIIIGNSSKTEQKSMWLVVTIDSQNVLMFLDISENNCNFTCQSAVFGLD